MQYSLFALYEGLDSKFITYHESNRHIYEKFKEIALRGIREKRFSSWSAEGVINVIRWETAVSQIDGEFKVNNNYKPFYARMFMNEFPQYQGFFRLRTSKADQEDLKNALTV